MKPLLFLLASMLLIITSCGSGASAIKYNDKIINEQEKVINLIEKAVNDTVPSSAEPRRKELTAAISASIEVIKKMPAFRGSTTFRDKALKLFEKYLEVFDLPYKRLMEAKAGTDSEALMTAAKEYSDKLADVETNYENPLIAEQRKFAADNNVRLKAGD